MNQEIKAQWTAALRSGDFYQGKYDLRSFEDRYCCLGVLCELGARAGETPAATPADDSYAYEGWVALLPDSVAEWAGIPAPVDGEPDPINVLMNANDQGVPFAEIADMIEEML